MPRKPITKEIIWLFSKRSEGNNVLLVSSSISSNSSSKLSVSHSVFCSKGSPSRDFNNSRFNNGNVKNNTTTINILNPLNIVSETGMEPITSDKKWSSVAINNGMDPDNPPCQRTKAL